LTGGRVFPGRYSPTGSNGASQLPEVRELTLRDFEIVIDEAEATSLRIRSLAVRDFAEGRETPFALEIEELVNAQGWLLWNTAKSNIRFGDLQFETAGQALGGSACLLFQEPPSLQVELEAARFDMDMFLENLPALGQGEGAGELPLDIRARFRVDELRSSGAIARGVVFKLGPDPVDTAVCGSD
jgi:hypothetical protein